MRPRAQVEFLRLTSEPRRRCNRRRVARAVRWRIRCRCCCGGTSSPGVAPGVRAVEPFVLRLAPPAACPMDGSERERNGNGCSSKRDRGGSTKWKSSRERKNGEWRERGRSRFSPVIAHRFRLARRRSGQDARAVDGRADVAAVVAAVVVGVSAVVNGIAAVSGHPDGRLVDDGRRDRRSGSGRFTRRNGLRLRRPAVARSVARRSSIMRHYIC